MCVCVCVWERCNFIFICCETRWYWTKTSCRHVAKNALIVLNQWCICVCRALSTALNEMHRVGRFVHWFFGERLRSLCTQIFNWSNINRLKLKLLYFFFTISYLLTCFLVPRQRFNWINICYVWICHSIYIALNTLLYSELFTLDSNLHVRVEF